MQEERPYNIEKQAFQKHQVKLSLETPEKHDQKHQVKLLIYCN